MNTTVLSRFCAHPARRAGRGRIAGVHAAGRGDGGSATVELMLACPLLVLLALTAVMFGRGADARLIVDDAAQQAARAATLARDPDTARTEAYQTAQQALSGRGPTCAVLTVTVRVSDFAPGGTVSVRVTCRVALADLGLGVPAHIDITGAGSSVIDVFRGVDP